jgi:DNA ligase (NAD+)
MDGVAVELVYERGALTWARRAATASPARNVTPNVRTIRSVPAPAHDRRRAAARPLEVRGEVYTPIAAFRALNREREEAGQPVFSNPRNSTRGSLKQLDSRVTRAGRSTSSATASASVEGMTFETHAGLLATLGALGLKPVPYSKVLEDARRRRRLLRRPRRTARTTCRSRSTASSSR